MTDAAAADATPAPPVVLGPIERLFIRPLIAGVRLAALLLSTTLWFLFAPVWFALLFRTVTAFSFATVKSLFTSGALPDPARLEYVIAFWPRGFGILCSAVLRGASARDLPRPSPELFDPVTETVIAIVLYTYVVITLAYIHYWLPFVAVVFGFIWWLMTVVVAFVFGIVADVYHYLYPH